MLSVSKDVFLLLSSYRSSLGTAKCNYHLITFFISFFGDFFFKQKEVLLLFFHGKIGLLF